ncbi:cold-shock protein [Pseudomonas sp. BJa5]|uniref:cold-shock protein n=1 Tax=Pseudomonas sp. BJa5 TaxID=2936270 RepID=UPI0025596740|nr:hypothetical protein [Pseudomonas sp. BGr12]MDL2422863.1 cold shock domain-containing protein [Pseudomonas sp. BGr12]
MSRKTHRKGALSKHGTGVVASAFTDRDIFFQSLPASAGGLVLRPGQRVEYDLVEGPQGQWYAVNIEVIDDPALN